MNPAALAAHGLASRLGLPAAPLGDDEFRSLLAACEQHRLVGLLGDAVRSGALAVTAHQRDQTEEVLASWLAHAVRVERLAQRVASALDGAGIESRFLKGLPLAHTAYPDPALRVVGDVDLLVRSADFTRAASVVATALDGTRALPELAPGFDDRFGREILVRVGRFEVDVHRTFVDGALGLTIVLEDLFDGATPFRLGTRELLALARPQQLLHACYASLLGDWPPRLMAQRDVAQLALGAPADADRVLALAGRWRGRAVLARAVQAAWDALGLTAAHPLLEWARGYEGRRVDRVLLGSYHGHGRGYTSQAASLLVLPGVRDRVAYVRALARPSDEYLQARGMARGDLRRRTLSALRRRARPSP